MMFNLQPTSRSLFTLIDLEGRVSTFAGTAKPDVPHSIQELAECAWTVEWSQLQPFIFSKQLHSGDAKSFARSQVNIKKYRLLRFITSQVCTGIETPYMNICTSTRKAQQRTLKREFQAQRQAKLCCTRTKLKVQIEVTYKVSYKNEQRTVDMDGSQRFASKPELVRKCFKCIRPT